MKRDILISLRLNKEEYKALLEICEKYGLKKTDVLLIAVRFPGVFNFLRSC